MLEIIVEAKEFYDERANEFIYVDRTVLQLEHSLISLSKWEAKHKKAFLKKFPPKTYQETVDYIKCMTMNKSKIDPEVYLALTPENVQRIKEYIDDSMSAVYAPPEQNRGGGRDVVTSELIYYWMISYGIPFECQKWHLNRLMSLIRVCNMKNSKPGRRNRKEMLQSRNALNEARLKKHNTKG